MVDVPLKLGVLVSHPIQYFSPVYQELAKDDRVSLTVLYRTRVGLVEYYDEGFGREMKWDVPLIDGYRHCFLSDKNVIGGVEWSVISALWSNRFDVLIVHGYSAVTNLVAILLAGAMGTKVLMRGDTRLEGHHHKGGLRSIIKRALFKFCDGFVTIGSLNRAYYLRYGVPATRLFFAPFCVSNEQFEVSREARRAHRTDVRASLGLQGDALLVLFAAKLVKRKRADDVIRAFVSLKHDLPNAALVIAGSGEEEVALRTFASSLGASQIRFTGFQGQRQLPILYAAADVFVLPSEAEPWGLVINEVMAAGVPVIVSDQVGAAADLVERQGTGIVFPCGDVDALSQAMRTLLAAPGLRRQMSAKAVNLIRNWGVKPCVAGILKAVISVEKGLTSAND